MNREKIIIGTRRSQLSLKQTDIVSRQLQEILPNCQIVIKTIETKGDRNMRPVPLDTVGKGWFTKELDVKLIEGSVDLAVHSLKDLPEALPEGLIISAIPEREDAREVLVVNGNYTFKTLPKGAIIGTDSLRRKGVILNKRDDLLVKSVRGNINRRIEKLDNHEYDALVLAAAGLIRLGMTNRIVQYFDINDFIPAPGQGALALVTRRSDANLNAAISQINHMPTQKAVESEREFSKTMGGGCKMPVGAYAYCNRDTVTLYGIICTFDGKHLLKDFESGALRNPSDIGKRLAERMLTKSYPWYKKALGHA